MSERPPYRRAVTALALCVLSVAVAVLVLGWMLDIAAVRSVFPGAVGMKALTAIGLGAGALGLALLGPAEPCRRRTTGLALTSRVRASDVVGRLGGDEFAILLLRATPAQSAALADELRAAIAHICVPAPDGSGASTASIGVAAVEDARGLSTSELLGQADAAMYRAKRAGGNRVALARDAALSPA